MPRSHHGRSTPQSLILPFALTLTTAALASAGLYFFSAGSSPPSSYPGSDSEHEPPRRSRDRPERQKKFFHDHITEEDTDALEDSLRQEKQFLERRRARGNNQRTSMRGAVGGAITADRSEGGTYGPGSEEASPKQLQQVQTETQHAESHWDPTNPTPPFPPPSSSAAAAAGGDARDRALPDVPISAVAKPPQYMPPPRRKKTIAIVVEERKATQGHESDEDFVEALLPTRPLLLQLPRPLKLTYVNLYILIHSPHLSSHPLSSPAQQQQQQQYQPPAPQALAASTDTLAIQEPSPMPSPSLQAQIIHDDLNKSCYELALSLLPASTPRENIMPFNTHPSVVPMLKQITPEVVYFEEAAVDNEGRIVDEILSGGGFGRVVIVVGGDDLDGLVSDDDEGQLQKRRGEGKWWGENGAVRSRHGNRLEVVEKWALEDDWRRRVEED